MTINFQSLNLYDLPSVFWLFVTFLENESKSSSSHLNYNDKNRLVAYTQQSAHGPLSEANVAPLGALDMIGKDRR